MVVPTAALLGTYKYKDWELEEAIQFLKPALTLIKIKADISPGATSQECPEY